MKISALRKALAFLSWLFYSLPGIAQQPDSIFILSRIDAIDLELRKGQPYNAQKLLNTFETEFPTDSTAFWYLRLELSRAGLLILSGQVKQSLQISTPLLGYCIRHFGEHSLEVARTYARMSRAHLQLLDYKQAHTLAMKSNLIFRQNYPHENHDEMARSFLSIGITASYVGRLKEAIDYTEKALRIYRALHGGKDDMNAAYAIENLANYCDEIGDFENAVEYHLLALRVLKHNGLEHDPIVATCFNNLGVTYSNMGEIARAEDAFKSADVNRRKTFKADKPEYWLGLQNLGNHYLFSEEYEKAEQAYQTVLAAYEAYRTTDWGVEEAFVLQNLGKVNMGLKKREQAIHFYRQALDRYLERRGTSFKFVGNVYQYLGEAFEEAGQQDSAAYYYRRAVEVYKEVFNENQADVAGYMRLQGAHLRRIKQFNEADSLLSKSYQIFKQEFGKRHRETIRTILELVKLYIDTHNYERGMELLLDALQSVGYKGNFEFDPIYDFELFCWTLTLQAEIERQTGSNHLGNTFETAIAALNWRLIRASDTNFRETLLDQNSALLEQAIQYWGNRGEVEQVFRTMEAGKALQLFAALRETQVRKYLDLPDSVFSADKKLRLEIRYVENLLFDASQIKDAETDSTVLDLQERLFLLRRSADSLTAELQRNFSHYYNLKYTTPKISLSEVRGLLLPGQSLMEYFVGDSSVYALLIRADTVVFRAMECHTPLVEQISALRHSIFDYHTARRKTQGLYEKNVLQYVKTASELYQTLVYPIKSLLTPEVVIIPDGPLGYLPFEALLEAQPRDPSNFSTYSFVVNNYNISYCYSAPLLKEMLDNHAKTPTTGMLLGFAPYFNGDTLTLARHFAFDNTLRKDLSPLHNSGEEVYAAQQFMGGDIFLGAEATEERFVQLAPGYKILHLATHGRADDKVGDYAFLAFTRISDTLENELLFARDIYNLSLNADLVTLSACETGIGKLLKGEGIVSLARAFAFAGAKSLMTSLWSVSDAATHEITSVFYLNLKNGKTKDAALAHSKRSYLGKHPGSASHPFFWAGLIVIGNMKSLR